VYFLDGGFEIGFATAVQTSYLPETPVCTATLAPNAYTSAFTLGAHDLQVDGYSFVLVVNPLTTAMTSLQATPPSPTFGQTLTLSATVSPSTATGNVTFYGHNFAMGNPVALNGEIASFSTSTLYTGTHLLTATYGGDTNDASSTSSTVSVYVGAATTTTADVGSQPLHARQHRDSHGHRNTRRCHRDRLIPGRRDLAGNRLSGQWSRDLRYLHPIRRQPRRAPAAPSGRRSAAPVTGQDSRARSL